LETTIQTTDKINVNPLKDRYDFIIDNMVWSFSRLQSFHQCPYQFKLQYIDGITGDGNFFSDFGTLCHNLLADYYEGKIEIYDLLKSYEKKYALNMIYPAPPNKHVDLNQSYYEAGQQYFSNIEELEDYKIIGVEKEYNFMINDIHMTGFVDLILQDKDGNIHIVDHKSSDIKSVKEKKTQQYWDQLHLYAIPIFEEYKKYPTILHLNTFRKQRWFSVPFNINEVDKVKKWVIDTINNIKQEANFAPRIDSYFCNFLCNFRNNTCEYRPVDFG
jgi:CRISPR/Cas system-associated exonuclease Cas4 (RecB family)